MGAYLDKPVTTKESFDGQYVSIEGDEEHIYAVSEMQGWRKTMEDAHITKPGIAEIDGEPVSIFGVFDGHGGKEVSAFVANHFADELLSLESFSNGDFKSALAEAFHRMDDMLRLEENSAELAKLRDQDDAVTTSAENHSDGNEDDEDDSEGGEAKDGAGAAAAASTPATRESIQADVKQRMDAAEQKGSLTKAEALELVMKMMKLKSMDEQEAGQQEEEGSIVGAKYTDAGCTAVVCLLHGAKLYVANAGDSRAVLSSGGVAKALSLDHKPTQEKELKRIRDAGGFVNEVGRVNGNLNLSRSIGDLKYKVDPKISPAAQIITSEPDVKVFDLSDEDEFIFIACDGVFDVMTNQRVVTFINEHLAKGEEDRTSAILEEIFEECICDSPQTAQGIGADNMTACVVLLKPISYFTDGGAKAHHHPSKTKSSRLFRTRSRNKTSS